MIKIAIADSNEMYLKRLHDYWSRTYGSGALMIYVYADAKELTEQLQTEKFDIVLISSQMEIDWEIFSHKTLKLVLLPGKKDGEVNGIPALAKNGNADELYRKIMELYENHMNISRRVLPGQLVYFTSGIGGCGTSSAAIGYGKRLASMGKRVLYVSLEEISGVEEMLTGNNEKHMEDLFYLCKTQRKNVNYSMENIVSVDESGLQYIAPSRNPMELMEKSKEDIKSMLETVTEKGAFDVVIVDRRLAMDEIGLELLAMSGHVVLVSRAGYVERQKYEQELVFLEELNHRNIPCISKLRILFNKSPQAEDGRTEVMGAIPMMPERNPRDITNRMKDCDVFDAILQE